MNRTSRTEEPYEGDGYNQSPNPLSNDLTTNQDFNGVVNSRELKDTHQAMSQCDPPPDTAERSNLEPGLARQATNRSLANAGSGSIGQTVGEEPGVGTLPSRTRSRGSTAFSEARGRSIFQRLKHAIVKFGSFVGPGFMIAVAYSEICHSLGVIHVSYR